MSKRLIALLLGSTALATSITFDPVLANPSQEDLLSKRPMSIIATSAAHEADDLIKQAQLAAQNNGAHQPLVIVNKDGKKMNPHVADLHSTTVDMNFLSYMIAKRQSNSDKLNRLVQLLNANEKQYAEYQSSLTDEYGPDCFDGLFAELAEFDHADRQAQLRMKISKTESLVKEFIQGEQEYANKLTQQGWEISVFEGKTGYKSTMGDERDFVPDDRGFVAFHPKRNIMEVIWHGSRNWDDWKINFDAQLVSAQEIGVDLPTNAFVHRGFALAAQSAKVNADNAILAKVAKARSLGLNIEDLNIIVSGHSQGAAVANVYEYMLVHDLAHQIWGADYKNTEKNNVKGMLFSAPRVLGEATAQAFDDEVGKDNTYRQNVKHDPVPNGQLRKMSEVFISWLESNDKFSWIKKVPYIGPKVSEALNDAIKTFLAMPQFKAFVENDVRTAVSKFSGYGSVGHLALDDTTEAMKRMLLPSLKAYGERLVTNLVDVGKNFWNWMTGSKAYNSEISLGSFLKTAVVDGLTVFAAPLHYGTTVNEKGGAFDPNVVGKNMNAMLAKGDEHVKAKDEKPGFFSRVKSFFGFGKSK